MPAVPTPPEPDAIPIWIQWVTAAGIMAGAAFASFRRFMAGKAAPAEPARQVVLEQASLADMKPLHEVADGVKKLVETVDKLADLIVKEIRERDVEAENARRAAEVRHMVAEAIASALAARPAPARRPGRRPAKPKP